MANATAGKGKAQGGIIRYARCSVSPDHNDHVDTKFYISDTSVEDASSSDFEPELSPPRNMKKQELIVSNTNPRPSEGTDSGESQCPTCDFMPTPVVCNECSACEDDTVCELKGVSLESTLPCAPCVQDPVPKTPCRRLRRCRPLYGNSPNCKFGPKASVMKNQGAVLTIQDPGSQRLFWYKPPQSVLIIKKVFDDSIIQPFKQIVSWLVQEKEMEVYIEKKVLDNQDVSEDSNFMQVKEKLFIFQEGKDDITDKIDLIICLGGDGTLLYASSIFQKSVPPVMAFNLGSLGFLTPFESSNFAEQVNTVLQGQGNVYLTLRTRLKCVVLKKDSECSQMPSIKHMESKKQILVLNEVVIDRGAHPYLCNLDLYIEGSYVTSVQGDGLIISTPTGSTAYAAGAGASMVHPNVPAIVITPICPHSLSFRPIVVPAGVEVKVMASPDARNNAWVSFDGRNREEIVPGDNLRVTTSIYPIPSICREDQISDWFTSLATCLHWNVRKQQRAFLPPTASMESIDSTNSWDSTNGNNNRDPNHGRLL